MTSKVKGHFYLVGENPMKYVWKKIQKNMITGLWFTRFQSCKFYWHDYIAKNVHKMSNFQKKISAIKWPLRSKIICGKAEYHI